MKHQRLLVLAVLAAFSLAAAGCSVGPNAVGVPVSGSWSTLLSPYVRVQACIPIGGHIKVEFDSTAGANPDRVNASVIVDEGAEQFVLAGPVGSHFEGVYYRSYVPGNCFVLSLWPDCPNPCPAWAASSQTFNYRVSIVP